MSVKIDTCTELRLLFYNISSWKKTVRKCAKICDDVIKIAIMWKAQVDTRGSKVMQSMLTKIHARVPVLATWRLSIISIYDKIHIWRYFSCHCITKKYIFQCKNYTISFFFITKIIRKNLVTINIFFRSEPRYILIFIYTNPRFVFMQYYRLLPEK